MSRTRKLFASVLAIGALFSSTPPASAGGQVAGAAALGAFFGGPEVMVYFPPTWTPLQAARFRAYLIANGIRVERVVGGRLAAFIPGNQAFLRIASPGTPSTMFPSQFIYQQVHGPQSPLNPLRVSQFNSAGYFATPNATGHLAWARDQVALPELTSQRASGLRELGPLVEFDQESLMAVRQGFFTQGAYSVVVRDRGQGLRVGLGVRDPGALMEARWANSGLPGPTRYERPAAPAPIPGGRGAAVAHGAFNVLRVADLASQGIVAVGLAVMALDHARRLAAEAGAVNEVRVEQEAEAVHRDFFPRSPHAPRTLRSPDGLGWVTISGPSIAEIHQNTWQAYDIAVRTGRVADAQGHLARIRAAAAAPRPRGDWDD